MASLNIVILLGHLGMDPEEKETSTGLKVCNTTIATNRRAKNAAGEWFDETEWTNLTMLGKPAELALQYLRKGSCILVEGRLKTQQWEKDGQTRKITKVIVEKWQFASSKNEQSQAQGSSTRSAGPSYGNSQPRRKSAPKQKQNDIDYEPLEEDEVPF